MPIPNRLSIVSGDAGEIPFVELRNAGGLPTILLDGIEQRECLTADCLEGMILRYAWPFRVVDDQLVTEIVRGRVEFRFSSPAE